MKARRSVGSLWLRNSLVSWPNAVIFSKSSRRTLRSECIASASRAEFWNSRSLCSRMRGAVSMMSRSPVWMARQCLSSHRRTSTSSPSMESSLLGCSWATPSICSSTTFAKGGCPFS